MKILARLINKEKPILLIVKNSKLKLGSNYRISFLDNQREEELISRLERFNDEFYCFKFVHKIIGAFKLKYQENYLIEINEK